VPQRTPRKIASPETRTIDGIEIVRFHAFAPPGSPLDRYTCIHLYCGIRFHTGNFSKKYFKNNPQMKEEAKNNFFFTVILVVSGLRSNQG
jgi:hypothetical protein